LWKNQKEEPKEKCIRLKEALYVENVSKKMAIEQLLKCEKVFSGARKRENCSSKKNEYTCK